MPAEILWTDPDAALVITRFVVVLIAYAAFLAGRQLGRRLAARTLRALTGWRVSRSTPATRARDPHAPDLAQEASHG